MFENFFKKKHLREFFPLKNNHDGPVTGVAAGAQRDGRGPSEMVGNGAPGDRARAGRAAASARTSGFFCRSRRALGRRGSFSFKIGRACACRLRPRVIFVC